MTETGRSVDLPYCSRVLWICFVTGTAAKWWSAWCLVICTSGCSPAPGLQLAKVSGSVKLDDQPLPEGVIVFTKDGEIPKELPIAEGRYEGTVYAGKNHIQFAVYRDQRQRSATGPGADQPSLMNILPSKYNQESKESRDVTLDGQNEFDFTLNSK